MPDALALTPPAAPVDARVAVPGSKSITNRALVAAALARGTSTLRGALVADDTLAMRGVLAGLGIAVAAGDEGRTLTLTGCAGTPAPASAPLDGRSAGTVARFLPPLLALGEGPYRLDGSPQMRARPLGAGLEALRALGVAVADEGAPGHLPIRVTGAR
ncbi:MAG: 3-phosphoshikimate 1-carboxyvinyltransferase, partial [Solirubrobacterales bacterium]|nr:3-phosphoshikimate 1-carboxyvinyltransferase [Solirubrobacterales bacterium]